MRNRNIKLNVFLNEREHNLLKEKSNKVRLTQSDFIRMLIEDYDVAKSKVDIDSINSTIKSSIEDLTKINEYMYRLRYQKVIDILDRIIYNLNQLINDNGNAK